MLASYVFRLINATSRNKEEEEAAAAASERRGKGPLPWISDETQ